MGLFWDPNYDGWVCPKSFGNFEQQTMWRRTWKVAKGGADWKRQKPNFLKKHRNGRFAPFGILSMLIQTLLTALLEWVACSAKLGHVKTICIPLNCSDLVLTWSNHNSVQMSNQSELHFTALFNTSYTFHHCIVLLFLLFPFVSERNCHFHQTIFKKIVWLRYLNIDACASNSIQLHFPKGQCISW